LLDCEGGCDDDDDDDDDDDGDTFIDMDFLMPPQVDKALELCEQKGLKVEHTIVLERLGSKQQTKLKVVTDLVLHT
jgi:hypothetical protein